VPEWNAPSNGTEIRLRRKEEERAPVRSAQPQAPGLQLVQQQPAVRQGAVRQGAVRQEEVSTDRTPKPRQYHAHALICGYLTYVYLVWLAR